MGIRTPDPHIANVVLCQLSYQPFLLLKDIRYLDKKQIKFILSYVFCYDIFIQKLRWNLPILAHEVEGSYFD